MPQTFSAVAAYGSPGYFVMDQNLVLFSSRYGCTNAMEDQLISFGTRLIELTPKTFNTLSSKFSPALSSILSLVAMEMCTPIVPDDQLSFSEKVCIDSGFPMPPMSRTLDSELTAARSSINILGAVETYRSVGGEETCAQPIGCSLHYKHSKGGGDLCTTDRLLPRAHFISAERLIELKAEFFGDNLGAWRPVHTDRLVRMAPSRS
ncbi:hypothetical protein B0H13DRAFT_1894162 [Mycena leptocephala]|nr:hypothetical protein B0H13DRAFT_1894162 [Mycena leptocephala]